MSDFENLQDVLNNGIEAARTGDKATARKLLKHVLEEDPDNELALMWLASTVDSTAERRMYLQQVVRINPDNTRARQALAQLSTKRGAEVGSVALQVEEDQARLRAQKATVLDEEEGGFLSRLSPLEVLLLIGLAIAIGAGFLAVSNLAEQQTAFESITNTPTPVTPSNTPRPTDPVEVIVTRIPQTLPPTFTPTATATETPTPTATLTPYPIAEFEAMIIERAPNDANPVLFQIDGQGANAQMIDSGILDVTYDLSGNRVALVKEITYPPDEQYNFETTVSEIFVGPSDNPSAAEQVTFTRIASAHSPSFSPDGNQLVYVSDFDENDDLWIVDLQTSLVTRLTENDAQDRDPDWSPDGTRIVFSSDRNLGAFKIYMLEFVIQQDGAQLPASQSPNIITQITNDQGNSLQPKWSDDAEWIAYINDRDGDGDVILMDKDGLRRQVLTLDDNGAEDKNPSFTPDRRYISFISNREDDHFQAYLVSFNGREIVRVTQTENIAETIDYRPMLIFRLGN